MSKKIQLTIPEPCHENWDAMTTVEKGKFCGSCQKEVIDFSVMSDRQLAEFFKKPSTGSVCGRFMTDQLDRNLDIPRKRIPWIRYFFQIALPAFLLSVKGMAAQKMQGKVSVQPTPKDTLVNPPKEPFVGMVGMVVQRPCIRPVIKNTLKETPLKGEVVMIKTIRGKVIDENGTAIPFASIRFGNKSNGVMADENGNFTLKETVLGADRKITVSAASFETREIIINKIGDELLVQLKANVVLKEVVINTDVIRCTKTIVGSVTRVTGTTITNGIINKTNTNTTSPVNPANLLTIYPNPARPGDNIHISFTQPDEGYYSWQLLTVSGQVAAQNEVWIDAEARLLNFDLPTVAAGTYFMVLTNKKTGKKISGKIILQ